MVANLCLWDNNREKEVIHIKKLHTQTVALAVGGMMAFAHLVWSLVAWMGWTQSVLDFIFKLHFLSNPYQVQPFVFGTAVGLIVVTFGVGYVMGWVFSQMWNMVVKHS